MLSLPSPIRRYSVGPRGMGPDAVLSFPLFSETEEQARHLQEIPLSVTEALAEFASPCEHMQLQTFMQATVMYDVSIAAHEHRIVPLVAATAHLLDLSREEIGIMCLAAFLHDLGKICLPYSVVQKPGPLNKQEWQLMHRHPALGASLLTFAGGIFTELAPIVLAHHEHWDGSGYPYNLTQEAIPLGARLISVIDSYDAMTTARPYSVPHSHEYACAELLRCAGSSYDPRMVAAFLAL